MEIKNSNCEILTNYEVIQILRNIKDTKKKTGLRNLATIAYETLQFLEDTVCKQQTSENIIKFLNEIKSYNLTKNECMMIVNNPPLSQLHIQLLVEDSEERLTEAQVQEIIALVSRTLLADENITM